MLVIKYGSLEFWRTVFSEQKQFRRDILLKTSYKNMQQIYGRTPVWKSDFNKVAKQLYWNRTSVRVLSSTFVAFLQSNVLEQQHCGAASEWNIWVSLPQPINIKL